MSEAPILRIVLQRHDMDCAVAVLAMLCGVAYEEALIAISAEAPNVLRHGVHLRPLQRAAIRLGFRLRSKRTYDLEAETGGLQVQSDQWKVDHLVVLREGLIVETDGLLWEAETFFTANAATPGALYVAEAL